MRAVATALGARVSTMTAAEHDDAVAVVSHVPQVAASLVASRLREVPDRAVEPGRAGVRDVTRIAASDPALWTQILSGNAAAVARVLHAVRADLDAVVTAVDALAAEAPGAPADGARAAVAGLVADGNEGRARIPGKHGAAPTRYVPVPVLVPDRPGEPGQAAARRRRGRREPRGPAPRAQPGATARGGGDRRAAGGRRRPGASARRARLDRARLSEHGPRGHLD
ncbi:hypothetical protein GCM10025868_44920 [Angustibacter aerolatus]|uniref:Prephenate/arogenate dehydrogenase domain-containing protein n=1 Tax=Angustibacter aerolatus TaxID=1162965 RepID=A0ABQ6JNC1_9ACTN|nr:prephenate dehydrogenase dimerization domain-containing protein [Angustibacter aerolatus]GMA89242.1 hypothetical protein GCM10025868_44920 [Angustibacter aerolatus]